MLTSYRELKVSLSAMDKKQIRLQEIPFFRITQNKPPPTFPSDKKLRWGNILLKWKLRIGDIYDCNILKNNVLGQLVFFYMYL